MENERVMRDPARCARAQRFNADKKFGEMACIGNRVKVGDRPVLEEAKSLHWEMPVFRMDPVQATRKEAWRQERHHASLQLWRPIPGHGRGPV